jgi:hypothetical protein
MREFIVEVAVREARRLRAERAAALGRTVAELDEARQLDILPRIERRLGPGTGPRLPEALVADIDSLIG